MARRKKGARFTHKKRASRIPPTTRSKNGTNSVTEVSSNSEFSDTPQSAPSVKKPRLSCPDSTLNSSGNSSLNSNLEPLETYPINLALASCSNITSDPVSCEDVPPETNNSNKLDLNTKDVASITEPEEKPFVSLPQHAHSNIHWTPEDDLTLTLNMIHLNDLCQVSNRVVFSHKFTSDEIEFRWSCLLYESSIANNFLSAIRRLDRQLVATIEREVKFSECEDDFLKKIPSNFRRLPELFEKLLESNDTSSTFWPYRTVGDLYRRWSELFARKSLGDQVSKCPELAKPFKGRYVDIEMTPENLEFAQERSAELRAEYDKQLQQIRILEAEVDQLDTLFSVVSGVNSTEFGKNVLATLRGHRIRFLIKAHEVTLGRSTQDCVVDIDLSLEAYAGKVSRLQAVLNFLPSLGRFMIFNVGTHTIRVDSKPVEREKAAELIDGSFLEIDTMIFEFRVNKPRVLREMQPGKSSKTDTGERSSTMNV